MPPHLQLADLHARHKRALQLVVDGLAASGGNRALEAALLDVRSALTTPTRFPEPPR